MSDEKIPNPSEPPQGTPSPVKRSAQAWATRGRVFGMPLSVLAIWAALFVAASAVPALPVPGMGGMITVNAIVAAISGVILGPAAAIANAAGGIIGTFLFPIGALFGPFGFLTVTLGGLIAGLLLANRWKLAAIIEAGILVAWFVNPHAWQPFMWIVPLPYSLITVLVIIVPPVRKWVRRMILTQNKAGIWPAVFLMCVVGHAGEYMTANVLTNWMFNLTWQYWVPTWAYWVGVDTIIIVLSTIVGVGVLTGLRRARLPHAPELYKE